MHSFNYVPNYLLIGGKYRYISTSHHVCGAAAFNDCLNDMQMAAFKTINLSLSAIIFIADLIVV